ncbi:uncharacterized protein LOC112900690 [Panicum hallii]|uniref:uncharacterized protein LOC112900690 n=1 Tax=Panicum hallii TaxID=206008 RepID=UPI000DF4D65D|nr:uncharacterized protein LOC112900690 [Panicum hallii]
MVSAAASPQQDTCAVGGPRSRTRAPAAPAARPVRGLRRTRGLHGCRLREGATPAIIAKGPPKKKRSTTKSSTEESIVPFNDEAPSSSMTFPPSHSVELTNKKSRKGTSDSGGSIRFKSAGSTNQPEPISIEFPMSRGSNPLVATKAKGKKLGK